MGSGHAALASCPCALAETRRLTAARGAQRGPGWHLSEEEREGLTWAATNEHVMLFGIVDILTQYQVRRACRRDRPAASLKMCPPTRERCGWEAAET